MTGYTRPPGKTTFTPDVLTTIARMATLEVEGVKRMAPISGGVNRIFRHGDSDGVRISIENDIVNVDLYVVLEHSLNIREVSRTIQQHVARAIQEMVGMEVGYVNIHIEDIDYENNAED